MKKDSVLSVLLSKSIGFLVFFILLFILNKLQIDDPVFREFVLLFNDNMVLFLTMFIVFMIAEIFSVLAFPFNLPAPLLNAIGSVFLLRFIFRIFEFVEIITGEEVFQVFEWMSVVLYPLVFLSVLMLGYFSLFVEATKKEQEQEKQPKQEGKSWQDIGDEFRNAFMDALEKLRKL